MPYLLKYSTIVFYASALKHIPPKKGKDYVSIIS